MTNAATKPTPYWWEAAPPSAEDGGPIAPNVDVAIVGAGYTGLGAAIELARAGRSVQLFDKQRPGEGASTRNGGITSGNIRPSYSKLVRHFGERRANAIMMEGKEARADLYTFIADEKIDCDFKLCGRFAGAFGAAGYETLARDAEYLRKKLGIEAFAVPKVEQHNFLGTDFYDGGNVRMDIGGLHPAKLHAGMRRAASAAGALIHGRTAVLGLMQEKTGWRVKTTRGEVLAREVIVATNGYSDESDRWLRRRIVPVRSRIIATADLSSEIMQRLLPKQMMCSDTRKLSYYYRPSPDGRRILFGGRDGTIAGDPTWPTIHLREALAGIFPELADIDVSHSWFGYVGMNRDMVPRIFTREGRRYAVGFCGSGVVWARWAGKKVACQLLANQHGSSAFDFRPPAAVPFFSGKAWFMPAVYGWLSFKDNVAMRKTGKRLHRQL